MNVNKNLRVPVFLLRISLGWLFFYAGITKVLDSSWSAAGFLSNAKTFSNFYAWFVTPANIGWVNFLNEWGLTLIGVALILGIFTRYASYLGIILMILYYFPGLEFPYIGEHSFIVDEHIIYALALYVLVYLGSGKYWGLDSKFRF